MHGKWDKAFWDREYSGSTIGNISEDAIEKEEWRKEDSRSTAL